jgi:hypothetical protein
MPIRLAARTPQTHSKWASIRRTTARRSRRFSEARWTRRTGLISLMWRKIPELNAKGPDFLTIKVFNLAAGEPKWPKQPPPEAAYVKGVRDAAAAYLKGASK